jgi:hypothetical protein
MGFEQGVEFWKNEARVANPLLCEEDGRSTSFAGGISSSTSTSQKCGPDMVDRFEYELDTTSPREERMKVVPANLAARSAAGTDVMAVPPDNRLADAPMVPVACRRCGDAVCNGDLPVIDESIPVTT